MTTPDPEPKPATHGAGEDDLLADYFEKSASAVRTTFGRFEQGIARPLIERVSGSFKTQPIRSTFIAVFLALSLFPILSFVGFSVFVVAAFVFLGLAVALVSASCVVGFFGFWLACTLVLFLFIAFNITAASLSAYLFARFVLHARQDGPRAALSELVADGRTQFALVTSATFRRSRDEETKPIGDHSSEGPIFGTLRQEDLQDDVQLWDVQREHGVEPEPPVSPEMGKKVAGVPVEAPP